MALSAGTRVGPYEITAQIGAGGMGEVYRATDTNLKRSVAIKVLPEAVATDAERLARFQREAEVLGRLNHPNIAQIHGLEKSTGTTALVMELVEGPTLADRIAQAPIPVDEALPIAKQIAEALEAAHEQGIIHRDLKPANIKLRADGAVKVLDFGLAKAIEPVHAGRFDATASPTITSPAMMTSVGMLLGTAAYMSPEQAKGRAADRRSDIWAFGCVLFEMLTGRRAFEGDDVSETLAAVLRGDPNWAMLPASVNMLTPVLRACMQKSVRHRMQDMGDVRLALEGVFTVVAPTLPPEHRMRRRVFVSVAIVGACLVAGGFAGVRLVMGDRVVPITRLELPIPADHQLYTGGGGEFALSPDGRTIAYIGLSQTRERQLFRRDLDQLAPVSMSRPEGLGDVSHPAWSPDGTWLSYRVAGQRLLKVSATGGSPITLVEERPVSCFGATWLDDQTLVFCGREGTTERLYRVSAGGGSSTPLTNPPAGVSHRYPHALPGSGLVFFTAWHGSLSNARVGVVSLSTGEEREIFPGTNPRLLSTGHLVFFREDGLWAVPFDQDRLSASGEPRRVIENVQVNNGGLALFSASAAGVAGYVTGTDVRQQRNLVWVDRTGREEPVDTPRRAFSALRISHDGTRVALDAHDQEVDIWTWDFARRTLTRVTFDPAEEHTSVWAPDGRRLIFVSFRDNTPTVFSQASDGTGQAERIVGDARALGQPALSPDGRRLVLRGLSADTGQDLLLITMDGDRRVQPLLRTPFTERLPDISPDGRWMAYESNESGALEVYVRPFPNIDDGRWQISSGGGRQPRWSRDGRELFFLSADTALMSAAIDARAGFSVASAVELFDARAYEFATEELSYDVARDGRFLLLKNASIPTSARITVISNWFEELKRLVPAN